MRHEDCLAQSEEEPLAWLCEKDELTKHARRQTIMRSFPFTVCMRIPQ